MAVYKRSYKQYDGPTTPLWSRFLVLPKYAFQNVFSSRWMTVLYVLCFVPTLVFGAMIYLRYNATFLETFGLDPSDFLSIDATFFKWFMTAQVNLTLFVTVFVGPGLVSADLSHNALPLYLCRPFSRAEYVLGKMSVLLILLSGLTWIPAFVLILMQVNFAGLGWLWENLRVPVAVFAFSCIWMFFISLLALAISAWVKWRPIAGAMILGIFFVSGGFGLTINAVLFTRWGSLFNILEVVTTVMESLFHGEAVSVFGGIPEWSAWMSLAGMCCIWLWLLHRRIRAYEVVH